MIDLPLNKSWVEIIPTTYKRFNVPQYDQPLPIHIFGTSSSGNSIYFKRLRLLVDIGLPMKRYNEYDTNFFNEVDYVLLTHEHQDHLLAASLLKVLEVYPHVTFIITKTMAHAINQESFQKKNLKELLLPYRQAGRFKVSKQETLISRDGIKIEYIPHVTPHGDITNIGIELKVNDNEHRISTHILYATDLDSLDVFTQRGDITGLPHPGQNNEPLFDLMFLEANYNTQRRLDYLAVNPDDYRATHGSTRHVSEEEAWEYVNENLKDTGLFIPLHVSSMFGTLFQN